MQYKYHMLGTLAESKAMSEFIKLGFFVFTPFSEASPVDFIAYMDEPKMMYRIQVRSTSSVRNKSYSVDLRSTNPMYNKNFDPSSCDILVCYIVPLDILCYIDSLEIESSSIAFRSEYSKSAKNQHRQWVMSDYSDLSKIVKL